MGGGWVLWVSWLVQNCNWRGAGSALKSAAFLKKTKGKKIKNKKKTTPVLSFGVKCFAAIKLPFSI